MVKLFIKLPYAWSSLFKRGCQGGAESEKIRVHVLDTAWDFGHSCVELEGNCTVLRRHIEGDRPEVHTLVGVYAGYDEEDARPLHTQI